MTWRDDISILSDDRAFFRRARSRSRPRTRSTNAAAPQSSSQSVATSPTSSTPKASFFSRSRSHSRPRARRSGRSFAPAGSPCSAGPRPIRRRGARTSRPSCRRRRRSARSCARREGAPRAARPRAPPLPPPPRRRAPRPRGRVGSSRRLLRHSSVPDATSRSRRSPRRRPERLQPGQP